MVMNVKRCGVEEKGWVLVNGCVNREGSKVLFSKTVSRIVRSKVCPIVVASSSVGVQPVSWAGMVRSGSAAGTAGKFVVLHPPQRSSRKPSRALRRAPLPQTQTPENTCRVSAPTGYNEKRTQLLTERPLFSLQIDFTDGVDEISLDEVYEFVKGLNAPTVGSPVDEFRILYLSFSKELKRAFVATSHVIICDHTARFPTWGEVQLTGRMARNSGRSLMTLTPRVVGDDALNLYLDEIIGNFLRAQKVRRVGPIARAGDEFYLLVDYATVPETQSKLQRFLAIENEVVADVYWSHPPRQIPLQAASSAKSSSTGSQGRQHEQPKGSKKVTLSEESKDGARPRAASTRRGSAPQTTKSRTTSKVGEDLVSSGPRPISTYNTSTDSIVLTSANVHKKQSSPNPLDKSDQSSSSSDSSSSTPSPKTQISAPSSSNLNEVSQVNSSSSSSSSSLSSSPSSSSDSESASSPSTSIHSSPVSSPTAVKSVSSTSSTSTMHRSLANPSEVSDESSSSVPTHTPIRVLSSAKDNDEDSGSFESMEESELDGSDAEEASDAPERSAIIDPPDPVTEKKQGKSEKHSKTVPDSSRTAMQTRNSTVNLSKRGTKSSRQ